MSPTESALVTRNPPDRPVGEPDGAGMRRGFAACPTFRSRIPANPTGWGIAMRPPFAMMALAGALAAPIAVAQVPAPATAPTPAPAPATAATAKAPSRMTGGLKPVSNVPPLTPTAPAQGQGRATPPARGQGAGNPPALTNGGVFDKPEAVKKDSRVFQAPTPLPAPTIPDQPPSASIALPSDPIEPFLLTRNNGPF